MSEGLKNKKVLVCPLDWGLGHATRCIPIIRELKKNGAEVIIAGDGQSLELLKQEFPDLVTITLRGYNIKFSRISLPVILKLIPRVLFKIISEHRRVKEIIRNHQVDVLISDNRYGLWNREAYTVFITHQPNIITPQRVQFAAPLLRTITRWFINKYNECWIPDSAGEENLSGKLSHGYPLPANTRFIGLLSRFEEYKESTVSTENTGIFYKNNLVSTDKSVSELTSTYSIIAILSGPEPQRTIFEKRVIDQLSQIPDRSLVIRGIAKSSNIDAPKEDTDVFRMRLNTSDSITSGSVPNISIVNHLKANEMFSVLKNAAVVICRGGYSTLMDLCFTGNKVICIPTPGQTEQEYLAEKGAQEMKCVKAEQESFSINDCLTKIHSIKGYQIKQADIHYKDEIKRLLQKELTHV